MGDKYNVPIHLIFMYYSKVFHSIERWTIFTAMNNATVDSRYKNLLKQNYECETSSYNHRKQHNKENARRTENKKRRPISLKLLILDFKDAFNSYTGIEKV